MKTKILLILVWVLFNLSIVSAAEITIPYSQRYVVNDGRKQAPEITIKATTDNEITKAKWISLIISEYDYYRFDIKTLTWISFSGEAKSKLWQASLSYDFRTLSFKVLEDFKKDDSITISWLGIIIYSRSQSHRFLWLDINWDWVAETYEINWIWVDGTSPRQDTLVPNEVFNLTGSLNLQENNITFSWINPGDCDFEWTKFTFLDSLNGIIGEDSNWRNEINQSYNIDAKLKYIKVQTFDSNINYSEWILLNIDNYKKAIITQSWSTLSSSWTTSTWVLTNSWITSSWTVSSSWSTSVSSTWSNIALIQAYKPTFTKYVITLNNFIIVMDKYILLNSKQSLDTIWKNETMVIRNDIAKIAEKFNTSNKDNIAWILNELKLRVRDLKNKIK